MNAVEEIQAAIDKLTAMKAESTPGPWHEWTNDLTEHVEVWHDQEQRLWVADLGEAGPVGLADANLIVTLHATIDAQLAILDESYQYAEDWSHARDTARGHRPESIYPKELVLARSILGGS